MQGTACICPDCLKVMCSLNYTDYLCKKVGMQVGIQTWVCVECGNSACNATNIRTLDDDTYVGRTEEVAVTCFNDFSSKVVPQSVLLSIIKDYYKNLFTELSFKIFNTSWTYCLEILVWEVINSESDMQKLSAYSELSEIKTLYKNTGLWPVNTRYWLNIKSTDKITFVEEGAWLIMLNKKSEILKSENEHGNDYTGKS